ncbi:hypothetical protein PCI56_07790 [Plesiomonas shigelloides subsp. oncorhynchi]|nr:hypothetical protein [Plesiomonas shigelloides]
MFAVIGGCDFAPSSQALGTLERDRLTYPAMAAETVIAMPVQEGQAVTRGTLLVQLDPRINKPWSSKLPPHCKPRRRIYKN